MALVLRLKPGDYVVLVDRRGRRFSGRLHSVERRQVEVMLEKPLPAPAPPSLHIVLCASLLRAAPMDDLVKKTSELGVGCIHPFWSERTVVRLDPGRAPDRLRHWQQVALSAAKQSDRHLPAEIARPAALEEILARWSKAEALKILLWEKERSRRLKTLLAEKAPCGQVVCLVGPEGGFTAREVRLAEEAGFVSASLGRRILRAETAAVALVALLQYALGDLG